MSCRPNVILYEAYILLDIVNSYIIIIIINNNNNDRRCDTIMILRPCFCFRPNVGLFKYEFKHEHESLMASGDSRERARDESHLHAGKK